MKKQCFFMKYICQYLKKKKTKQSHSGALKACSSAHVYYLKRCKKKELVKLFKANAKTHSTCEEKINSFTFWSKEQAG